MSGIHLLLSDARGIYIPRDFVEGFDMQQWHIEPKFIEFLSCPDNDFYWDYWEDVLNNAFLIDDNGHKWCLWQDGDLLAICYKLLTEDEKTNFDFED